MDGRTDRRTDRRTDGRTDGQVQNSTSLLSCSWIVEQQFHCLPFIVKIANIQTTLFVQQILSFLSSFYQYQSVQSILVSMRHTCVFTTEGHPPFLWCKQCPHTPFRAPSLLTFSSPGLTHQNQLQVSVSVTSSLCGLG